MNLDLNLLQIFDAVARFGSVTKAARHLALSQPAVSHALNRLRRQVGDALFTRSGRGLLPTPRALQMVPEVRRILDATASVLAPARFDPATARQDFRIGASDYAAFTLLPALMRSLSRTAPLVRVQLLPTGPQVVEQLELGQLDLSFWGDAPPPAPILYHPLFTEHYVGVARSGHPVFDQGPVGLEGFLAYPHAVVSMQTPGANALDRALARMGQHRRVGLASHSFAGNLAALAQSDLLASLPSRLCTPPPAGLRLFDLPLAVPSYGYGLVWHPRSDGLASHHWLRDQIVAAASAGGESVNKV